MIRVLKTARNALIHFLILLVIFLAAVFIFARAMNQMTPNTSGDMASATFPLVYMQNDGVSYNCLHGYAYEMDVNDIRDTVTILNANHELDIRIQPFESNVSNISYEVLSLDGSSSLENTSVINLTEEDGHYDATLTLQNQMLLNQEYILKLQMTAGEREVYFYTRLLMKDGLHLDSYLDFVTGFYEKCVNKTDQASLGLVVEPDETSEMSQTLAEMDLHDTVAQLMWGDLNPQINYKPTPSLVDINGTTASFVLQYRISAIDEDNVTNLYNITEFYRLRYTDSRVFLLDFTRTTEEVFNTERSVLEDGSINLGITGQDVEYLFSAEKNAVAFVEGDELWSYETGSDTLTQIFSFAPEDDVDYRDFYNHNNIDILRVAENGDVFYLVSGYMNRGDHEGENGIAFYHYDEASSTSEELMFIRVMESYDALKLDLSSLSYLTESGDVCYLLLEDIVYRIDMETGDYEEFITGIRNGCSTSSKTGRYFSWLQEEERYNSQTLNTIDFETGQRREVSCDSDERIRPLCYLDDDLVYGIAKESDLMLDSDGTELFPMSTLIIVNEEGEILKTYAYTDIYVTEVEPAQSMLTLTRVIKSGEGYAETISDTIVSTNTEENVEYGISTQIDEIKQAEILLRVGRTGSEEMQQMVSGKFSNENESQLITIQDNPDREKLYDVYAGGSLESRWPTVTEAIWRADEKVGVVINDEKEYVWERGNKEDEASIKLDNIPDIVKTGTMNVDLLEEGLGKVVVDLTGCTLDQVLYFVSAGKPVIADTADGSVIITGYDDFGNLILLDPGEEETYFYGPNDSLEMFEASGNRFVSYLSTDAD